MRDFYDVYELVNGDKVNVEKKVIAGSFFPRLVQKGKQYSIPHQMERTLQEIRGR